MTSNDVKVIYHFDVEWYNFHDNDIKTILSWRQIISRSTLGLCISYRFGFLKHFTNQPQIPLIDITNVQCIHARLAVIEESIAAFARLRHSNSPESNRHRDSLGATRIRERYLGVLLVIVLLRTNPSRHQVVPDTVGQGKEVIAGRGDIAILRQGVVKVSVEGLLEVPYILDVDDATHWDLLPLLVIGVCRRHDDDLINGIRSRLLAITLEKSRR